MLYAALGAGFGAGHGRVHVRNTAGVDALGKFAGGGRGDGAGINQNYAFAHGLSRALGTEQNAFHGFGIGNAKPYDFGAIGGVGGRTRKAGSFDLLAWRAIPYGYFVTGFD